jgi:RNA polymerase sigma factor (sigma-70 family)
MWLFKKNEYLSDEELINQFKVANNKQAFAELYKKYVKLVYGTCLFYFQDKSEAQDATMQLFEKLMIEIKQRDIVNFKGWLSFVVRNHCISIIRKNKSYQKNIKSFYEFEYEPAHLETEDKISSVTDELLLEYMSDSLNELKDKQRICIELFYIKNKSYQEISEETSFTVSEVKSYIQNGKRNLKLLIEEKSKPQVKK